MKVALLLIIMAGGLVWWLGGRRLALLFGVPESWTTKRGQVVFAIGIIGTALLVTSLPYFQ